MSSTISFARVSGALTCALLSLAFSATSTSTGPASTKDKLEWTPDLEKALVTAAVDSRVVMVALGEVDEGRTERHLRDVYPSKAIAAHAKLMINVPAWSFDPGDERALPRLDGITERDHLRNLGLVKESLLRPNDSGVIALPQHIWLSPEGEVLVSCPWEIDALEFAWCSNEALRRAGIEERPELPEGAHPPRRLLMGQTYRVVDEDELGRGLKPKELKAIVRELNKRFAGRNDRQEFAKILFTDDADAVHFIRQQIGLWDVARNQAAGIIDGTISLSGLVSPAEFIEVIDDAAGSSRESRRVQAAVAYEQIGSCAGLKAVKRAWKKEKTNSLRAEWARALGACGRGDKTVAKMLIRAASKDKSSLVRKSAILGLGHVLPEASARAFLEEMVTGGHGLEREAAIIALALGRAVDARELLEAVKTQDIEASTAEATDAALKVLDGGNLDLIESEVARISESKFDRERLFFAAKGTVTRLRRR